MKSKLYIKDIETGVFAFFPERIFVRSEVVGDTLRIYSGNCVIEHNSNTHHRYRVKDYAIKHATESERNLIIASEGMWDTDPDKATMHLHMGDSDKLGWVIEGRFNPGGEADLTPNLDDPDPDDRMTQTQKIVKRPRIRM